MKAILVVAFVAAMLGPLAGRDLPEFGDWGPPENLGPTVNGPYSDTCVSISRNGRSLFFSSTRQTGNPSPGETNRDLYVSHRENTDDAWGEPAPLAALNTPLWDSCPALSLDEHRLYMTRPGACGERDIWVSYRQDRRDDFGWEPPVNLGCQKDGYVNTDQIEVFPTFFEDESGKILDVLRPEWNGHHGPLPERDEGRRQLWAGDTARRAQYADNDRALGDGQARRVGGVLRPWRAHAAR